MGQKLEVVLVHGLWHQPGHGRGVPDRVTWERVESTYLRCEQDRALSPDLQERMGRRCTKVVRLDSSHSPFISRPRQFAGLILRAQQVLNGNGAPRHWRPIRPARAHRRQRIL